MHLPTILLLLTLAFDSLAAGQGIKNRPLVDILVSKVSTLTVASGSEVGFGRAVGEFYKLSKAILRCGTVDDFKEMLKSDSPMVRVMGLVCLAQTIDEREFEDVIRAQAEDKAEVSYVIGCIIYKATIGRIAEKLAKNPFLFGR
jgi:hypothetical protein